MTTEVPAAAPVIETPVAAAPATALGAVEVSRDTSVAADPAAVTAAETALAAATTPESKAAAQAALDALKPPVADPAKAAADTKALAVTAAEKTLADAKTPEEKAAATKALAELKDTPGVAPEKYEAFTLPDGLIPDATQHEAFGELAKTLNLSQLQAQKLVDFEVGRVQEAVKTNAKAWNDLLDTRLAETKADPEIGGAKYDESIASAHVALKQFGTPELAKYLSKDAAGSHKEVVRFLAKVGSAMADDKIVLTGGRPIASTPLTQAQALYPSMRPKAT
jgi:hypothetical protein